MKSNWMSERIEVDRYYVKCEECGNRAYGIPGEKETYFCSHCESKFTSEEKPKVDSGGRIAEKVSMLWKRDICKKCKRDKDRLL